MGHTSHSQACATPKTWAEIRALREASVSQRKRIKHYSVSKSTIFKWRNREDTEDRLRRAYTPHTALSTAQELIVAEL
ncbi:MAG: hypothetical protein LBO79_01170 [Zoogloeaceae bacterium]|jgi:cytochrome c biogenesis protein ResB|nr:hypothetical protein [Zoogloeaceae bacterium]